MDDEEAHVKRRRVGVTRSRYKSESSSGVKRKLLAGYVPSLEVVNFQYLPSK